VKPTETNPPPSVSSIYTWYFVKTAPPSDEGAVHEMLIEVMVDCVLTGVPGALGATADLSEVASDAGLSPTALVATTLNS